jgi:hypothetical protein
MLKQLKIILLFIVLLLLSINIKANDLDSTFKNIKIIPNEKNLLFQEFKGKKIKQLLDSIGRDYFGFIYHPAASGYGSVSFYYNYSSNVDIDIRIEFERLEYINHNLSYDYYVIEDIERERIKYIFMNFLKVDRQELIKWEEQNLKNKQMTESAVYKISEFYPKYKPDIKINEYKYYELKNSFLLENFNYIKLKYLLDSIGNNFYGYLFIKPYEKVFGIDYRYDYKDSLEISVVVHFKDKIDMEKENLKYKDLLDLYASSIFVYILPASKRNDIIRVKK